MSFIWELWDYMDISITDPRTGEHVFCYVLGRGEDAEIVSEETDEVIARITFV